MRDRKAKVDRVWVAVSGYEVVVASTMKGIAEETGLNYHTMKSRGSEVFTMMQGGKGGEIGKKWFVVRKSIRRVGGRGVVTGNVVGSSGGFRIIE